MDTGPAMKNGPVTDEEASELVRIIDQYCSCETAFVVGMGWVRQICRSHEWGAQLLSHPAEVSALIFQRRWHAGRGEAHRDGGGPETPLAC